MGTRMAPSYANLFMDRFERSSLAQEPILPLVWKRHIDDILCIWTGTRSELLRQVKQSSYIGLLDLLGALVISI